MPFLTLSRIATISLIFKIPLNIITMGNTIKNFHFHAQQIGNYKVILVTEYQKQIGIYFN